jgi:regulatory protein YycI of two-component signal transduction system YycFG
LADRLAFFKKYHGQFYMSTLDGNLKVTPEMAELLGLSKDEQQAVEQHLAEIKSEMDKLEDDNTVLAKQTANSASFETAADPQGKTIKAQLDSLLSSDISDERAEVLTSYIYDGSSNTFSGFAERKREIEISWTVQNSKPLYTYKESYLGPDGNVNNSSGSSGDSLPSQYQKLLQGNSAP